MSTYPHAPTVAQGGGIFTQPFNLIARYRRAYLITNVLYYGLILVGMGIVVLNPSVQDFFMQAIGQATSEGGVLGPVVSAYETNPLLAIGLTFVINLFLGSLIEINLPSLIVPFSGWLLGAYRALVWGFIFAPPLDQPLTQQSVLAGVLLAGLLFLEGQGYVLAMFAAYVQGRTFLWHRREGAETLGGGYWLGLKRTAWLYVLVALVLIIAAIYEVGIYQILVTSVPQ